MSASGGERGFTLIELLVVAVLIAVIAASALLAMPVGGPGELQKVEAQRLLARMALAREEAILQSRTLGLHIDADGYAFSRRSEAGWDGFTERHPLRAHELPAALYLELELEGMDAEFAPAGDNGNDQGVRDPQIFFLPGGEILPWYRLHVLARGVAVDFTIMPGEEQWFELNEHRH